MKKAIILGVMAFFAINIATVQNVNAQDSKGKKPTTEKAKIEKEQKADEAAPIQKEGKLEKQEKPAGLSRELPPDQKAEKEAKPEALQIGKKECCKDKCEKVEKKDEKAPQLQSDKKAKAKDNKSVEKKPVKKAGKKAKKNTEKK